MATIEIGNSKVNVGSSMTGEALFTSVSNALTSLCLTLTSDSAWTSCQTGTVNVGKATYLDSKTLDKGDLTITVTNAEYNSTDYLNLFINIIAGAANVSAQVATANSLTGRSRSRREILIEELIYHRRHTQRQG